MWKFRREVHLIPYAKVELAWGEIWFNYAVVNSDISGVMVISVFPSAKAARLQSKPFQQTTQSSSSSRINFPSLYFSELS